MRVLFLAFLMFHELGCAQADTANKHLASMDSASNLISDSSTELLKEAQLDREQLKRIADSMNTFEDLAKSLASQFEKIMAQFFAAKPPAITPNIDDVLGPVHSGDRS